jgi:hypothetical protein
MFVKNFSWPNFNFTPFSFNQLTQQQKINVVIASIACGILLVGSAYWMCSNFWNSRRITPKDLDDFSPMPYKFPKESHLDSNRDKKLPQKKSASFAPTFPYGSPQLSPKPHKIVSNESKSKELETSPKKKDEHVEKNLSSESIDSAQPFSPRATKVSIRITSSLEAGFVGDEPELIPNLNKFKLANQTSLSVDPTDVIISLNCFGLPAGLLFPSTIYLPAFLFEDLEEGNSIQIYYEDQLLELCLHQAKEKSKFEEGNFEDVLELARQAALEKNHPLFGHFIPYSWYKLDGGTVYRVMLDDHDHLSIKAVPSSEFRPLQKTSKTKKLNEYGEEEFKEVNILKDFPMDILCKKEGTYFVGDLPGFSNNDVDCIEFILNENLFATHILPRPTDMTIKIEEKLTHRNPQEYVIGFKWKKAFPKLSLEEMQKNIEKAPVVLKDGIFQIFFPNYEQF